MYEICIRGRCPQIYEKWKFGFYIEVRTADRSNDSGNESFTDFYVHPVIREISREGESFSPNGAFNAPSLYASADAERNEIFMKRALIESIKLR